MHEKGRSEERPSSPCGSKNQAIWSSGLLRRARRIEAPMMADRLGRVPVLAIGASLVVAASGIAGTAPSHDAPQLAAGLALLGFGWSAGLVY